MTTTGRIAFNIEGQTNLSSDLQSVKEKIKALVKSRGNHLQEISNILIDLCLENRSKYDKALNYTANIMDSSSFTTLVSQHLTPAQMALSHITGEDDAAAFCGFSLDITSPEKLGELGLTFQRSGNSLNVRLNSGVSAVLDGTNLGSTFSADFNTKKLLIRETTEGAMELVCYNANQSIQTLRLIQGAADTSTGGGWFFDNYTPGTRYAVIDKKEVSKIS